MKVVLGILFLTFSNANIQFAEKKPTWRFYNTTEALSTTKKVEIMNKKEFAKAVLNGNVKVFLLHIISLSTIYLAGKAKIALLFTKEIAIPAKYLHFLDIFLEEKALILQKLTNLIQHAIKLQNDKQPLYGPVYNLGPVKLKTLKPYIKTNLVNGFIWPLKLPARGSIFFV